MQKSSFFYLLLFLGAALCLPSCKDEKHKAGNSANLHVNDFESHFGYIPRVQKGKAHSGEFYYAMDSTTEFSLTFMEKFGNISKSSYAKMKFSSSLFFTAQENNVALTIQIWDATGNPVKVESKTIGVKDIGLNKWGEASVELSLSNLYAPNNEVRCFVYNPGRQNVYIDDMQVEFFQ